MVTIIYQIDKLGNKKSITIQDNLSAHCLIQKYSYIANSNNKKEIFKFDAT